MGDPITLTNTCKSFDCNSHPLRLSSNPEEITCSSSECSPAECCTEAVAPPLNVRNVVLGVEIMVAFVAMAASSGGLLVCCPGAAHSASSVSRHYSKLRMPKMLVR